MNEKDIEEKAEQFEAALEGLMCAMEELRKDRDRLKKLAERPRGRWILVKGSNGKDYHKCSECLHTQDITGVKNYCSVCGADMRG